MSYKHFTVEERELIQLRLWEKESVRSIARELKRSPSSVSREINRNVPLHRAYPPRLAHERALAKRKERGRKLRLKNQWVRRYVVAKLQAGYSPEQIAGRMPQEISESISHEAIYQYIYATIHQGIPKLGYPDLRLCLKRRHKQRAKKGMRKGQRLFKPQGPSIETRPQVVAGRQRIGDWEADTMESCQHRPGINTLVERKTGLVFITKLRDKTGSATREAIEIRLRNLPQKVKYTITLDNGPENRDWQLLAQITGLDPYYAHPYCSGERGTNENTNGLVRWYFPKGTDFATIPDEHLRAVEYALNPRPRKRLGWRTPLEVFNESVALQG